MFVNIQGCLGTPPEKRKKKIAALGALVPTQEKKKATCNNRAPVQLPAGQRLASEAMLLGQERGIEEVI